MLLYLLIANSPTCCAKIDQVEQIREVRLSPAEAGDFEKGMAAIAKMMNTTIIAEGVPQTERRITSDAGSASGLPIEILKQFAASYDYGVLRVAQQAANGKEIFLLAKKYSTGNEVPCVTEGEYIAAFADLNAALATFAPNPPLETSQKLVRQTVDSLSEDEKRLCLKGGISLSQLSEESRRMLWRLAADTWLGSAIQGVNGAKETLSEYKISGNLGKANQNGFEYLTIEIMTPSGTIETTEDGSVIKKITGQVLFTTPLFSTSLPSDEQQQTMPPELESFRQREREKKRNGDTAAVAEGLTLKALLQILNKQNPAHQFEALPYLGSKVIRIAGIENASPADIMTAVSRLYGLRLQKTKTSDKDIWRLQRPPFTPLRSPVELPAAAFKALPLPLLRATGLLNDLFVPPTAQKKTSDLSAISGPKREEGTQLVDPITRMAQVRQECRSEATARIEKILLRQPKPTIHYRDLPENIRSEVAGYIAISHTITLFQALVQQSGGIPPAYIGHFDESILTLNTDPQGGAITGVTLSCAHLPQRIGKGSILSISLVP